VIPLFGLAAAHGALAPLLAVGAHVGVVVVIVSVLALTFRKTAPYAQQILREWNIRTIIKRLPGTGLSPDDAATLIGRLTQDQPVANPAPEVEVRASFSRRPPIWTRLSPRGRQQVRRPVR
jgi:hypothetical protein